MKTIIFAALMFAQADINPGIRQIVHDMYAEDPMVAHAVCASWNGAVAVLLPEDASDLTRQTVISEGLRHSTKVREAFGQERTNQMLYELLKQARADYNSGTLQWTDLVDAAAVCAGL